RTSRAINSSRFTSANTLSAHPPHTEHHFLPKVKTPRPETGQGASGGPVPGGIGKLASGTRTCAPGKHGRARPERPGTGRSHPTRPGAKTVHDSTSPGTKPDICITYKRACG
ncbi:MAG TPA: hypothetical protein VKX46_14935, partial [Ktedonobacteraceae bacterium]|nr:hypothetical protein [Ktedonobacteraceae bacterium]